MSVSTIYQPVTYAGDDSSVTFVVPWMFLEENDLQLFLVDGETETPVTAFTATGMGEELGGTVTVEAAVPSGITLKIKRYTDRTQENDYTPHGRFPAESVEQAFDKLTLIDQEQDVEGSGGGGTPGTDDHKVIVETDDLPGTLDEKLVDSDDIEFVEAGTNVFHKMKPQFVDPMVVELLAFPAKDIFWLEDEAGDLWDSSETPLAFRIDFLTNGHKKLFWFKSLFSANAGSPVGRFAIYGELAVKLCDEVLPDSPLYGIHTFATPIDISDYKYLVVVMDPGVSTAPQPVAQSILTLPTGASLGRYSFAHMVEHEHNTEFPETAPELPSLNMKFMLARQCFLGVR